MTNAINLLMIMKLDVNKDDTKFSSHVEFTKTTEVLKSQFSIDKSTLTTPAEKRQRVKEQQPLLPAVNCRFPRKLQLFCDFLLGLEI